MATTFDDPSQLTEDEIKALLIQIREHVYQEGKALSSSQAWLNLTRAFGVNGDRQEDQAWLQEHLADNPDGIAAEVGPITLNEYEGE